MDPFIPLADPGAVNSILSEISIFGGVTEAQQNEIFSRLEIGLVPAGQHVFRKGDEPSHIYIVKSGLIELYLPDNDAIIEKKRLGVGECFGQVALMSIHQHTISAVALEDTEVIVLSRRTLHQLRHEDIELFALLIMNIARELARRLQYTDALLLDSYHMHAEGREPAELSILHAP